MNERCMATHRFVVFVRDYRNTSLYTAIMVTIILLLEILERLN